MESEDFINNQHILCRQLKMNKDLFDCETLVSFGAVPRIIEKKVRATKKNYPPPQLNSMFWSVNPMVHILYTQKTSQIQPRINSVKTSYFSAFCS